MEADADLQRSAGGEEAGGIAEENRSIRTGDEGTKNTGKGVIAKAERRIRSGSLRSPL
jgi:hypothetical protein